MSSLYDVTVGSMARWAGSRITPDAFVDDDVGMPAAVSCPMILGTGFHSASCGRDKVVQSGNSMEQLRLSLEFIHGSMQSLKL